MLIPLYDDNPFRRISYAYVNWALIAANVLVFAIFQSGYIYSTRFADTTSISFGMIPVVFFSTMDLPSEYIAVPHWLTPLTSAFLHGSWMHLAGNMLFLWVFGDNVEDDLGHLRYLVLLCGLCHAGRSAHAFALPQSTSPLIGASGAVSGVVAAYVLLHPRVKIWVLVLFRIPLEDAGHVGDRRLDPFQAVSAYLPTPPTTPPGSPISAGSSPGHCWCSCSSAPTRPCSTGPRCRWRRPARSRRQRRGEPAEPTPR